jgi:radical SAM family RiPP maturation amino acid epimerase
MGGEFSICTEVFPFDTYTGNGQLNAVAEIKRFLERFHADPNFQTLLRQDPARAILRHNLAVEPEVIRPLWDTDLQDAIRKQPASNPEFISPAVRSYTEFHHALVKRRDRIRAQSAPGEKRWRHWRARQLARTDSELGLNMSKQIIHAPFAIELCNGCSVGCRFCGISAPRLSDIFFYTEQNRTLWKETLRALKQIAGPASENGFCYWATDPLDNPDYEKFLLDFYEVMGSFPQTTTALPLKNPSRTRTMLKMTEGQINRFSILSLKMLDRVHQEFSAQELLNTELLLLNPESRVIKANAGRFRDQSLKNRSGPSTIACVSGFLINMVERKVKLVTPCPANDQWPLGYMVLGESRFDGGKEMSHILECMISKQMRDVLTEEDRIAIRSDLNYRHINGGFALSSRFHQKNCRNSTMETYLQQLGDALQKGTHSAGGLALVLFYSHGIPHETTMALLNKLFQEGCLQEPVANKNSINKEKANV